MVYSSIVKNNAAMSLALHYIVIARNGHQANSGLMAQVCQNWRSTEYGNFLASIGETVFKQFHLESRELQDVLHVDRCQEQCAPNG